EVSRARRDVSGDRVAAAISAAYVRGQVRCLVRLSERDGISRRVRGHGDRPAVLFGGRQPRMVGHGGDQDSAGHVELAATERERLSLLPRARVSDATTSQHLWAPLGLLE